MTCSISSLEKKSCIFIYYGMIFYQTLTMHIVKERGKSIRKTAARSLNKLKSSKFK